MITHRNSLDICPGGVPLFIRLSQYDSSFTLIFDLFSHKGTFTVENGTTARFRELKPDGNAISIDATISGTTVTLAPSQANAQQMTAIAGNCKCELSLFKGDKELNTANFTLLIEKAVIDKDTPYSDSVIRELIDVTDRADEIMEAAETVDEAIADLPNLIDPTLTQSRKAADAKKTGDEISNLKSAIQIEASTVNSNLTRKVNQPLNSGGQPVNGTNGQVLRTKGNGSTEWATVGLPTDEQTAEAVESWLDEHPEATTTVQDGAITKQKLADTLKREVVNAYVTPQSFGAVGDGVTDDTSAFTSFLNADGVKFVPAGDYLVSGTVRHYSRGVLGNGDWDNSLLSAYSVWFPNGANPNSSIVFNSGEKDLTNNEMASIVLQEVVHYEDSDPTPNENFTRTTGLLYTGTYEGYSANTSEATTQNFAGIQSIICNNFGGIIGTSAIQGRLYIPAANAAIQQYGGNKGVAVGGGTFTELHCSHGGYAYGAEFDCYDNCNEGTFPTYQPGDALYDANSPRVTASLVLSVSGKKQPATACLITNGAGNTGAWYGIYVGGSTFGMNGQYGVAGTVGINFAGWKKNGRYAHTAIRFGYANRHIVGRDGIKIAANSSIFAPLDAAKDNSVAVIADTAKTPSFVLGTGGSGVTSEDIAYNERARLLYNDASYQAQLRSYGHIVLRCGWRPGDSGSNIIGYIAQQTAFRPTALNYPSLGESAHPFGTAYIGGVDFTGGNNRIHADGQAYIDVSGLTIGNSANADTLVRFLNMSSHTTRLSFGHDAVVGDTPSITNYVENGYVQYSSGGQQLQIASTAALYFRVNKDTQGSLQGYVLNGSQFRPAHTTKPSFGDSTRRWGTAYFDTLNLNGVTLNSTQLTQLLALLSQ